MKKETALKRRRQNHARTPAPPPSKPLFAPAPADHPDASDPSALADAATLASGRAMKGRLWAEAKALAGLAESYARLADKAGGGGGGSVATMDLSLLCEIVVDADGAIRKRFRRVMDGRDDPDLPIKERYWTHVIRRHDAVDHNLKELMFRALSAERELRRLGGTPKINRTDVEIEEWVRHWLGEPLTEANFDHRTKLGEWPWR